MMAKLRVALGTIYPYDETQVRGGVEAVALYLTQALARRDDIDLHVVSCNRTVQRDRSERRGRVTFHWLATGSKMGAARAATIDAWRVRRVFEWLRPDVTHTQGVGEYAVAARSNMALSIHGVEPFSPLMLKTAHFQGVPGQYRRWTSIWLTRQSIRHASAVVSNSGEYVPRLLNRMLNDKPVYYIANPIAGEFFRLRPSPDADSLSPVILWSGTIAERKNVLGLVQAFAIVARHCPEARLLLIGGAPDPEYLRRVLDTVASLGLTDQVTVAGRVNQDRLLQSYADAAMLVMPSLEETAPMAMAQAMAAGKPVIGTRVGGIPWMVQEGVTGYVVEIGDTQALAERMIDLIRDKPKCKQMGQAAGQWAQTNFAPDAVADRTMEMYQTLAGGNLVH